MCLSYRQFTCQADLKPFKRVIAFWFSIGCFPLGQTDRSETSGNTRGKWNDIFRLLLSVFGDTSTTLLFKNRNRNKVYACMFVSNRANQEEWLSPFFIPFPAEFPTLN